MSAEVAALSTLTVHRRDANLYQIYLQDVHRRLTLQHRISMAALERMATEEKGAFSWRLHSRWSLLFFGNHYTTLRSQGKKSQAFWISSSSPSADFILTDYNCVVFYLERVQLRGYLPRKGIIYPFDSLKVSTRYLNHLKPISILSLPEKWADSVRSFIALRSLKHDKTWTRDAIKATSESLSGSRHAKKWRT